MDLNHIPYKGFGQVSQATLGSVVDLAYFTFEIARPLISAGKAKPVAVYLLGRRHALAPDVPDFTEFVPNFRTSRSWIGMFGPAGLPAPLVKRLNAAAVKALNAPAVKSRLEQNGAFVMANSPEQFDTMLKEDFATATKVATALKAKGVKFE
jgi:tripartite-type tricarboxylate transporter receptor subunit TctC